MKIARSEIFYYCYIHMPTFRIVLLLHNLSLGGKLCLRDDKYTVFVQVHHPLPLQASMENVTLRALVRGLAKFKKSKINLE